MRLERLARLGAAAMVGLAVPWLLAATAGDPPAPIQVSVGGRPQYVSSGTTLGQLAAEDGLRPRPGALVSVLGHPLEPGRYPGRIELGGRAAASTTVLLAGAAVSAVDGADHTEPVRTVLTPSQKGEPPSPEYELGRAPGMVV